MHADLSRLTHRPERHYSAVVAQQGRVQLDADANEQTAIQLFQARTLAADLIGGHGGPSGATGFKITLRGGSRELDDLVIGGGRYYVDGILCDATRPRPGVPVPAHGAPHDGADDAKDGAADRDGPRGDGAGEPTAPPATWTYWDQPDGFRDPERPGDRLPTAFPYLAYLKVWERVVTAAEDPALREVALGSAMPDTAARTKVVWQVLPLPAAKLGLEDHTPPIEDIRKAFTEWARKEAAPGSRLAARSERPDHADDDPCLVAPDARYRGPENQLYRVEVHDAGSAKDATFKWSRENGSVTFPVDELDGTWVELASLGSDDKLDLNVGDRVEFVDTAYTSRGEAAPLLRVEELDLPGRRVRLSDEPAPGVGRMAGAASVPAPLGPPRGLPQDRQARCEGRAAQARRAARRGGRVAAAGGRRRGLLRARRQLPHRRLLADPGPYGHRPGGVAHGRGAPPAAGAPVRYRGALRAAGVGGGRAGRTGSAAGVPAAGGSRPGRGRGGADGRGTGAGGGAGR